MSYTSYSAIAPSPFPSPLTLRPSNSAGLLGSNLFGGVLIGIAAVLVGVMLFFCFRRRFFLDLTEQWMRRRGGMQGKKLDLRLFDLNEVVKATNNFSQDSLIGSGAFGNVYLGSFEEDGFLAIKRAHSDSFQSVEEFRNEVELISRVKHRNLVGLMGYCEEPGPRGAKILIYEYVPHGSLLEYITGRNRKTLSWRQRVNIAIGAAKGIAFLHEGVKPSIIHRDIKPSNILVGDGFEAKVSDFGLVKTGPVGDQSHVSSQVKGTPGYLDPAYCTSYHLSPFSDVYSFGVILLQLVAARPAVDTSTNNSRYHIIEWARPSLELGNVEDIVDVNLLSEPCNMEMMLKMGQLGLQCVVKVPKERPTITQVWKELEEALYSTDNLMNKQASRSSRRSSQSFVSIDGVGLQRFHIEMDESLSFQSTSLRCFENNSISIDIDNNILKGITEETSTDVSPA
ncbi:hypothetical protein ACHQM5_024568 [Ranunculus cassubicifolius]